MTVLQTDIINMNLGIILSCFARFRTVNHFTGSNVCIFGTVSSQEQSHVKVKLSRVAASENFACCKNLHGAGIPARNCAAPHEQTEISLPVMPYDILRARKGLNTAVFYLV